MNLEDYFKRLQYLAKQPKDQPKSDNKPKPDPSTDSSDRH